jgi:hypothetical protein
VRGEIAVPSQPGLFEADLKPVPGSMNDSSVIRTALVEAIRRSGHSREVIADKMSALTGTEITVRRINAFTAESREDYRFPLELARAFCTVTGDFSLLHWIAELSSLRLITDTEFELLCLGREYLIQKRASETIGMLEKRLQGVEL